MSKKIPKGNLTHNLVISFASILVLSTAVVYGVIKNSPIPNQKSVAGVKEELVEKVSNPQKKQRNQSEVEYLKKLDDAKIQKSSEPVNKTDIQK
jgi:hypothetical protein